MSWRTFAQADPDLAAVGQQRLDDRGLLLLGTIRRDGTPRISPVEPLFLGGELYLGMMWRSKKALDLLRDPRCLVHSIVTRREGDEGDFKVRGRAVAVQDPAARGAYADGLFQKIDWRPEEPYHLFRLAVEDVALVSFSDEKMTIRRWPAP